MSKLVFSLTQQLRRLAWSHKFALWVATRIVNLGYRARKFLGLHRRAGADSGATSFDPPDDLRRYHRYITGFCSVSGWFWDGAIVTWDVLLIFQRRNGVPGNLLEIGVFKGKSAALMALHTEHDETLVLVDPALRREARDVIERIRPTKNLYLQSRSQDVRDDAELARLGGSFRWVHIDGEHSGPAVNNDLDIAARLIGPRGIICLDDFFSPGYPQITAATLDWLHRRSEAFTLFLVGYSKGYVCRTDDAPFYLTFIKEHMLAEFERRDFGHVTIWKTSDPSDMNCFGVTPRHLEYGYRGPDWAPTCMSIDRLT